MFCLLPVPPTVSRSSFSRDHLSQQAPSAPSSFTPWQLGPLAVGEASSSLPGQMLTSQGFQLLGSPTGTLQTPSQRTRDCVPKLGSIPRDSEVINTLCPYRLPGNYLVGKTRVVQSSRNPAQLLGGRHRQSSHLSPHSGVADAREGRGPEAGTRTPERRESASWDVLPPAGLANSQRLLGAAVRGGKRAFPLSPRPLARGPGARTPERKEGARRRTYRAPLARAARSLPDHRCRVRPCACPAKFKGDGSGGGGREREGREGEDASVTTSSAAHGPGGPGTRRGEGSARAPMSSLSFSPPRAPPCASHRAPPASSTGPSPRFSARVVGGWRRRGRRDRRER